MQPESMRGKCLTLKHRKKQPSRPHVFSTAQHSHDTQPTNQSRMAGASVKWRIHRFDEVQMEVVPMFGWKSRSWFYPKPTGDPGRDRNARTLQFSCLLLTFAVGAVLIVSAIGREWQQTPLLVSAITGLVAAVVMNRAGRSDWAGRTAFLVVLLSAILLVFQAHDGFRSHSMLVFPGLLLISGMMLNRAAYVTTAGIVVVAVAALGIAAKHGLTRATPPVRTTYDSIFYVDLNMLVIAIIGGRIASDAQSNVFDLRATIDRVSKANLTLEETAEALRESEQQLASIYNTVRDIIFHLAVDPEGRFRFVSVNAAFLRVTGLSREAVIGKTVNEVIPEPSLAMVLGRYRQAIEENTTVVWEETSDYPGGRLTGEVSVAPVFDNKGNCTHLVGSVHDITERKRAEEIVKASEEKYRALVETTDTGYLITDKEGKVIDANREYVRLTGHSELGEILGRSVIEWTAAHEKQKGAEAVARCVKDGFIRDLVIDYVDGENRITPVEINAKVTRGGGSLRIISLCRDISDRKRAEEMRLQLKLTQAQKMESIGRLAGGVAHDFNNLLTVMNGYAALLSRQLAVRDPLRRYALEIGEAGRHAASLTSQLLAFSRKQAIVPRAINLNTVLANVERMLQRLIGEDIELVSSLAPHLGLVMADPDQIHQIIMNLAVNARDAMPKGGKFEIITAEVELDETAAAAHPDAAPGRYVQLTVTDTGTGMTEEVRWRIFEPFYTTKEQGKGTGLGLSMVFGIVRQHEGWIDVKSEPGRGSTFRIHLPRIDGGSKADEAKPAAANVSHGDETVLIVEDHQAVRGLARRILEEHGYQVLEAASGAEAHAVASRHAGEIDLLLTDVVMPGMDGYLLSEEMRDLRPNLRTILMSGYGADLIAHRDALASGLAYIQKPFRPEELATKVREILDSPV
jgi:two-component system, cell cycle sensor histidine kinase and response regulator CckA